jgi:hypothetical protein
MPALTSINVDSPPGPPPLQVWGLAPGLVSAAVQAGSTPSVQALQQTVVGAAAAGDLASAHKTVQVGPWGWARAAAGRVAQAAGLGSRRAAETLAQARLWHAEGFSRPGRGGTAVAEVMSYMHLVHCFSPGGSWAYQVHV